MVDVPQKVTCSFCGKNHDEVRKVIAGPKAFICDECVDLCNDIIAEETLAPEDDGKTPPPVSTTLKDSFVREVVGHYANTVVQEDYRSGPDGTDWYCQGCGWRLRLKRGMEPPQQHSEQIALGLLDGPLRELPRLELVPQCPSPEWKRFP